MYIVLVLAPVAELGLRTSPFRVRHPSGLNYTIKKIKERNDRKNDKISRSVLYLGSLFVLSFVLHTLHRDRILKFCVKNQKKKQQKKKKKQSYCFRLT